MSSIVLSFNWGHEEPPGVARIEMKDQPLPLNSAVDLWPWVDFSLGFFTSFGRLTRLRCLKTTQVWNKVSHFLLIIFTFNYFHGYLVENPI